MNAYINKYKTNRKKKCLLLENKAVILINNNPIYQLHQYAINALTSLCTVVKVFYVVNYTQPRPVHHPSPTFSPARR